MTTRFFQAIGTLAVALVVLAGCDSAGLDSGSTADLTASPSVVQTGSAARGADSVTGTDPASLNCYAYYHIAPNISTGRPGTWSVSAGTIISMSQSGNNRNATVQFGDDGSQTVTFTSGTYSRSKSVTVNVTGDCATDG